MQGTSSFRIILRLLRVPRCQIEVDPRFTPVSKPQSATFRHALQILVTLGEAGTVQNRGVLWNTTPKNLVT